MSSNGSYRVATAFLRTPCLLPVARATRYSPLLKQFKKSPPANETQVVQPLKPWSTRIVHQSIERNILERNKHVGDIGNFLETRVFNLTLASSPLAIRYSIRSHQSKNFWRESEAVSRRYNSTFQDKSSSDRSSHAVMPEKAEGHIRKEAPSLPEAASPFVTNKHIISRLSHMPHMHRPSKEELLAAATGFWSRLKVRFKWFSIRSARPFNADEIGAFFSWFLLGHVLWIVLGTTTFFSLAIFAVNTVFAQGMRFPLNTTLD